MLNGMNGSVGVASVATAALQLALVQQSQFKEVLEETVDRKREEAETLRQSTNLPVDEIDVKTAYAEDAAPVVDVPAEPVEPARGETVNIEV